MDRAHGGLLGVWAPHGGVVETDQRLLWPAMEPVRRCMVGGAVRPGLRRDSAAQGSAQCASESKRAPQLPCVARSGHGWGYGGLKAPIRAVGLVWPNKGHPPMGDFRRPGGAIADFDRANAAVTRNADPSIGSARLPTSLPTGSPSRGGRSRLAQMTRAEDRDASHALSVGPCAPQEWPPASRSSLTGESVPRTCGQRQPDPALARGVSGRYPTIETPPPPPSLADKRQPQPS